MYFLKIYVQLLINEEWMSVQFVSEACRVDILSEVERKREILMLVAHFFQIWTLTLKPQPLSQIFTADIIYTLPNIHAAPTPVFWITVLFSFLSFWVVFICDYMACGAFPSQDEFWLPWPTNYSEPWPMKYIYNH